MSATKLESERRVTFYSSKEVAKYIAKNGVPKSKRAFEALIAAGMPQNEEARHELLNILDFVHFEVHPQQINVRDKANGRIITSIRR